MKSSYPVWAEACKQANLVRFGFTIVNAGIVAFIFSLLQYFSAVACFA
jgi:hypothetical protein